MNKKDINKFVFKVKRLLPLYSKKERRYIKDLKNSITDYSESNPNATIDDVINEYGNPNDIVQDYIGSMDTEKIVQNITKRRIMQRILIVILILLTITMSIFTYYQYLDYLKFKNSIIVYEETVITDD